MILKNWQSMLMFIQSMFIQSKLMFIQSMTIYVYVYVNNIEKKIFFIFNIW